MQPLCTTASRCSSRTSGATFFLVPGCFLNACAHALDLFFAEPLSLVMMSHNHAARAAEHVSEARHYVKLEEQLDGTAR